MKRFIESMLLGLRILYESIGIFSWTDVDLVVQKSGNKFNLSEKKFAELTGYDPKEIRR